MSYRCDFQRHSGPLRLPFELAYRLIPCHKYLPQLALPGLLVIQLSFPYFQRKLTCLKP